MPEFVDDTRRQVVPRWWDVRTAASLGQLDAATPLRDAAPLVPTVGEVEGLLERWRRHPSRFHAAELVDAALALERPHVAEDAAIWIVENGGVSSVSERLARKVLGDVDQAEPCAVPTSVGRHQRVSGFRHRLRQHPRNPVLWVELAREYSALGEVAAARKALLIAIALAPNSRHVLRSASRFFLHAHQPDVARDILLGSSAVASDPWLMSAEIVSADAAGTTSRLLKRGRTLVESGRLHPRHTSELASAIGTLEHAAGNRKHVRRLFAHALADPTENSLAQAGWIERHMSGFAVPGESFDVPRAFEAHAWEAVQRGAHSDAVSRALDWALDEPFATRPVLFASWVTSMALGDFQTAADMAEAARVANPGDPRLVAQLLYCKASVGQLESARALLPELERLALAPQAKGRPEEWEAVIEADRGLLAFRSGDVGSGRAHYQNAIEVASRRGLKQTAATALVNFAREEAVATGFWMDDDLLQAAVAVFPTSTRSVIEEFVARIPRQ